MKSGNHTHVCRYCGDTYTCQAITHCQITDKNAICPGIDCQDRANSCAVDDD